eukprot:1088649-Prymnesium_polylepis.3
MRKNVERGRVDTHAHPRASMRASPERMTSDDQTSAPIARTAHRLVRVMAWFPRGHGQPASLMRSG